jgi:hypothetical protein
MKEYICIKDFYIEDVLFAKKGDYLTLQSDNLTVTNDGSHQSIKGKPYIVDDENYFAQLYWENPPMGSDNNNPEDDNVNHPSHYTQHPSGIECIEIIRYYCFTIGSAIKYLWRAGLKKDANLTDKEKEIEDLQKAIWCIKDRIKELKKHD